MFWEKYTNLCKQRLLTPTTEAVKMGFGKRTVNRWKNGSLPRTEGMQKIADYFGVPVSYFFDDDVSVADINPFFEKIEKLCEQKGVKIDDLIAALPEETGKSVKYKNTPKRQSELKQIADFFGIDIEYLQSYTPIYPVPEIKKEAAPGGTTSRDEKIAFLTRRFAELPDDELNTLLKLLKIDID